MKITNIHFERRMGTRMFLIFLIVSYSLIITAAQEKKSPELENPLLVTEYNSSNFDKGRPLLFDQVEGQNAVRNGALIGLGLGLTGGYFWGKSLTDEFGNGTDSFYAETMAIVGAGGAGIGALIGLLIKKTNKKESEYSRLQLSIVKSNSTPCGIELLVHF
jgi:hypothetical protein